jgi:hypothetical protein
MDTVMSDAIKILVPNVVLLVLWYLDKQKNKQKQHADIENKVTETFNMLNSAKDGEIKRLTDKVNLNANTITALEEKSELQEKENQECKITSATLELEISRLKNIIDFHGYEWERVSLLDDNQTVTTAFAYHFKKASVRLSVFNDPKTFVKDVNAHQPCILIIDNWLGEIQAAEVIEQLTYSPDIILMSQDFDLKEKFKNQSVLFFPKKDNYVFNIMQAVIDQLKSKYIDINKDN